MYTINLKNTKFVGRELTNLIKHSNPKLTDDFKIEFYRPDETTQYNKNTAVLVKFTNKINNKQEIHMFYYNRVQLEVLVPQPLTLSRASISKISVSNIMKALRKKYSFYISYDSKIVQYDDHITIIAGTDCFEFTGQFDVYWE